MTAGDEEYEFKWGEDWIERNLRRRLALYERKYRDLILKDLLNGSPEIKLIAERNGGGRTWKMKTLQK